jgi:two-component system response regulator VicR
MLGLHVLKADDYITKPFSRKELIKRTRDLLRTKAE